MLLCGAIIATARMDARNPKMRPAAGPGNVGHRRRDAACTPKVRPAAGTLIEDIVCETRCTRFGEVTAVHNYSDDFEVCKYFAL